MSGIVKLLQLQLQLQCCNSAEKLFNKEELCKTCHL